MNSSERGSSNQYKYTTRFIGNQGKRWYTGSKTGTKYKYLFIPIDGVLDNTKLNDEGFLSIIESTMNMKCFCLKKLVLNTCFLLILNELFFTEVSTKCTKK